MIIDQHELRVRSGTTELEPLENAGTITVDRGWSPHVQGTLTVRAPDTLSVTSPGSFLTIELTQRFGDFALTRDLTDLYSTLTTAALTTAYANGTSATLTALITAGSWVTPVRAATGRTFELVITARTRTRDEHSLTLASREALFQDWLWYDVNANLEGVPLTFTADTTWRYLERVLVGLRTESSYLDAAGTAATIGQLLDRARVSFISPTAHTLAAGEAPFEKLQQLLAETRQRLYSPGDGTTLLVDYPYTGPGEINLQAGVNLIDWEITDERFKPAMVRFTGTDSNPAARPIYSSHAFPELNRPHEQLYDAPHKPILATGLVNGITAQVAPFIDLVGLDKSPVKLTTVNDYSVTAGSPISYTLPDEAEVNDTIDAITWQLGGRFEMDIWV